MIIQIKKTAAIIAAAVLFVTACPTVSSKAVSTGNNERPDIHYSEMVYERFDSGKLKNALNELKKLCENKGSIDENKAKELYNIIIKQSDLMLTNIDLHQILSYNDLTNSDMQQEQVEIENECNEISDEIFSTLKLALNSQYSDTFEDIIDEAYISIILDYNEVTEEDRKLQKEETRLVKKYESATESNFSVAYGGQIWNEDKVYNNPPEDEEEQAEILDMLAEVKNKKLGEIYIELVKVRSQIAELNGYSNYGEYAYENLYNRDYSLEDTEELYSEVKKSLLPVEDKLNDELNRKITDKRSIYMEQDGEEIIESVQPYMSKIDPKLGEVFEYMHSHHLYDLEEYENKMQCGFTTPLYSYSVPFIYNYPQDSFLDFETVIHEFGHFYNAFNNPVHGIYSQLAFNIDVAEIHSQGLELLFTPYLKEIFADSGEVLEYYVAYDIFSSISEGCLYDEFQKYAYDNPQSTLDELNDTFYKLAVEYGYSEENWVKYMWTRVPHNFNNPMYYISYAVSALSALDLWTESGSDREAAIEKYLEISSLDSTVLYRDVLESNGLRDVFEKGSASEIANDVWAMLNNENVKETESSIAETNAAEENSDASVKEIQNNEISLIKIFVIAGIIIVIISAGYIFFRIYNKKIKEDK